MAGDFDDFHNYDLGGHTDYSAEPQTPGEIIPAGDYVAAIVDGDLKPTKDGNGLRLTFQWKIQDGEFAGRIVFDGINIQNQSAKAQEIAQAHLSAIRHAIGKPNARTPGDYMQIPCLIRVKVQPDKTGQYGPRNEIGSVKPWGQGAAMQAASTARQMTPPPPAARPGVNSTPQAPAGRSNFINRAPATAQR